MSMLSTPLQAADVQAGLLCLLPGPEQIGGPLGQSHGRGPAGWPGSWPAGCRAPACVGRLGEGSSADGRGCLGRCSGPGGYVPHATQVRPFARAQDGRGRCIRLGVSLVVAVPCRPPVRVGHGPSLRQAAVCVHRISQPNLRSAVSSTWSGAGACRRYSRLKAAGAVRERPKIDRIAGELDLGNLGQHRGSAGWQRVPCRAPGRAGRRGRRAPRRRTRRRR